MSACDVCRDMGWSRPNGSIEACSCAAGERFTESVRRSVEATRVQREWFSDSNAHHHCGMVCTYVAEAFLAANIVREFPESAVVRTPIDIGISLGLARASAHRVEDEAVKDRALALLDAARAVCLLIISPPPKNETRRGRRRVRGDSTRA